MRGKTELRVSCRQGVDFDTADEPDDITQLSKKLTVRRIIIQLRKAYSARSRTCIARCARSTWRTATPIRRSQSSNPVTSRSIPTYRIWAPFQSIWRDVCMTYISSPSIRSLSREPCGACRTRSPERSRNWIQFRSTGPLQDWSDFCKWLAFRRVGHKRPATRKLRTAFK